MMISDQCFDRFEAEANNGFQARLSNFLLTQGNFAQYVESNLPIAEFCESIVSSAQILELCDDRTRVRFALICMVHPEFKPAHAIWQEVMSGMTIPQKQQYIARIYLDIYSAMHGGRNG